jgi:DNA-binding NarL/FixJ family response regulator
VSPPASIDGSRLRVVVADDSGLLRDSLVRLLSAPRHGIDVVGDAASYDDLMELTERHVPDVVITDIRMPPTGTDEGIRAAARLRTTAPTTAVIVLSQHLSARYAVALLEGGSAGRGYLLKDRVSDVEQLVDGIRLVAAGGSVIDPAVVEQLIESRGTTHPGLATLTRREHEVLELMATGASNAAIAAALVLSERAVEKHISSLFVKLDLPGDGDLNRRVRAVLILLDARSRP